MSARKDTAQKKLELTRSLRQSSHDGTWSVGEMLPTTRELAEKYGISSWVVTQELQKLVEEGVLHTIPRVGTFVGRPFSRAEEYYLMLQQPKSAGHETLRQVQIGFEERVAALGGASLVMTLDVALEQRLRGELPPLSGVFDFAYFPGDAIVWQEMPGVPSVCFIPAGAEPLAENESSNHGTRDEVHFDDNDGGRQATQHLLCWGHRQIAFLGLHNSRETGGIYAWSAQREAGWRAEMQNAGHSTDGLSFCPLAPPIGQPHNTDRASEIEVATQSARALVRNRAITAVVAANDYAALGIFAALREAEIPTHSWPSIVSFDDLPQTQNHAMTSLRLPWEEIGSTAVDLLWERKQSHGDLARQKRLVKPRLISRLTSRQNWSQNLNHATLTAALP